MIERLIHLNDTEQPILLLLLIGKLTVILLHFDRTMQSRDAIWFG